MGGSVVPPFNVVALDPGGTTGIATAYFPGGITDPTIDDFNIKTDELGPEEHHTALFNYLSVRVGGPLPLTIITEKFEFRQHINKDHAKTKVELISREYIGLVKLICAQTGAHLKLQSSSQAKHFVPDKKLDLCGIMERPATPMRHRNDALRHLIRYLVIDLNVRAPITDKWR
jgi:hypothetical protein